MSNKPESNVILARLGIWTAMVASLPFLIGAVMLGWKFVRVPDAAGSLVKGQVLEALLFAFGFALGLVGTAVALSSESASRRMLGTATTLFGCAHIVLGLAVMQVVEEHVTGSGISPALHFIIPTILWAYSVYLAIRAPGVADQPESRSTMEEQPQLQSQP